MKKFFEKTKDGKFYYIELDDIDLTLHTAYGNLYDFLREDKEAGRKGKKTYKKLETAERNFEKKCKELEGKGYVLSDPQYPIRCKKVVEKAKLDKAKELKVTVYHEKNFEEIAQLTQLEKLTLHGDYSNDSIEITDELLKLKNLKKLVLTGNITKLPDDIDQLKKLEELHLVERYNGCQMTELPQNVANLKNLKSLKINRTSVEELPLNIGKLSKLETLDCSHSQLKELPLSIGDCKKLENVQLEYTQLTDLPLTFGKLQKITSLDLSNCPLSQFPIALSQLKKLKSLNLSNCSFTSLPPEIGDLTSLTDFTYNNWSNKLKDLPIEFSKLKKLTKLELSGHEFTQIPEAILKLSNLESLNLHGNQISTLQAGLFKLSKLKALNLQSNQLKQIPEELYTMYKGNLKDLNLNYNLVPDVPYGTNTYALFKHLGYVKEEERPKVESQLSENEKEHLVMQYQERFDEIKKLAIQSHYNESDRMEEIRKYLFFETDHVPLIRQNYSRNHGIAKVWTLLNPLEDWNEMDHRIMGLFVHNAWGETNRSAKRYYRNEGMGGQFFKWYKNQLEQGNDPDYEKVVALLKKHEKDENLFDVLLNLSLHLVLDDKPTQFAKKIIERFKENKDSFVERMDKQNLNSVAMLLIRFELAAFEPYLERWIFKDEATINHAIKEKKGLSIRFHHLRQLYLDNPKKYEDFAIMATQFPINSLVHCQIAVDLKRLYGDKHEKTILQLVKMHIGYLANNWDNNKIDFEDIEKSTNFDYANWLVTHYKEEIKEAFCQFMTKNKNQSRIQYFDFLKTQYPDKAVEIIASFLENPQYAKNVFEALQDEDYTAFHDKVWQVLGSGQKAHRILAANELKRLYSEKELLKKLPDLLASKDFAIRDGAVRLLFLLDDKQAKKMLKETFQIETEESLRKDLLTFWWNEGEEDFVKKEVLSSYKNAKKNNKLKSYPKRWLNDVKLPNLYWKNGKKADKEFSVYLFQKQKNHVGENYEISQELELLTQELDLGKSGDFADTLLKNIMKNGGLKSPNKALSPFVTLFGDERVIDPIKSYCISNCNVVAPTILGHMKTDKAARALDAIMLNFKTKYPNVRGAAQTSFDKIADKMGITRMELMDKMIPDFGFDNLFKTYEINGEKWRAFINGDLKLSYINELDEIKKTLPSKTPKEIKDEIKVLNKEIRTIAKNQKLGLEQNFIAQRRWKTPDWQAHFMEKPLMFAFAQTLIWGIYQEGKLTEIFGVSEDQTLENADFDEVELPDDGTIGMVHPLELNEEQKITWTEYLQDNETKPPFEQINRPVYHPTKAELLETVLRNFAKTSVSDYRFRSLMEKRGWKRGSVVDGGMIDNYLKSYDSAGIEVFVHLDEMYVYLGEYSENIEIQEFYFVKSGSVKTGSYVYDTYKTSRDERLIKIQDLPPVVYSETMYDFNSLLEGVTKEES